MPKLAALLLALTLCARTHAAPLTVRPADAPTLQKAVAAYAGKRPVIVNFWATWCPQCVAEYPALVKLSRQYRGKVVLIGVSADRNKDTESKVVPFLTQQKAAFPQYLIAAKDPEDFILAWDKDWTDGALPRTYLYNKQGKRVQTLAGEQTYAAFAQAVKPLLTPTPARTANTR